MSDEDAIQQRIRDKAYDLWQQEGCPEGREAEHWEKARILVAIELDRSSLVPIQPEEPEEAKLQENLGEFPAALTDEGDRQQAPSLPVAEPVKPAKASAKPRKKK